VLSGAGLPGAHPALLASVLVVITAFGFVLLRRVRGARLPAAVRTYMVAQRWLRAGGLPPRGETQTPAEHLTTLRIAAPGVAEALQPLAASLQETVFGRRTGRRVGVRGLALAALRHRLRRAA